MKLIAFVAAICALSQAALAQSGDCKLIADATVRLACYDKAAPRAAADKPAMARPLAATPAKLPASKTNDGKYVDTISAEDALMNARLKNICRGC
ncbi:MAG: hypothetical protein Q7T45_28690 [Bradyrhizobium sp.]|uniref:hypothetical protein n=1 Tax=Bradyrhizobium sp. TaxID=376 RepID=UPI002716EE22|nr:hypothetical protein [Bradyrhizobium sp.]MDO8401791.1 hypothetical protein [Bradyrhizobium sp.]